MKEGCFERQTKDPGHRVCTFCTKLEWRQVGNILAGNVQAISATPATIVHGSQQVTIDLGVHSVQPENFKATTSHMYPILA